MQESRENKIFFSTELLDWYERSKRDLPWRRHRDPYYIWVSEIMLQQTRVDTVIPYFHRFIERFPTIQDLAEAPEEEVLKCWEGLGYYSRARNLQAAARQVVERHGGAVPDNKADVSALKGVGPYTAGAIMSIAFNRPEPAVDGNVMRVLSRYFLIDEDIMKTGTRTLMENLAAELIPEGRAADFNQALMELGALVCTPKSPQCLICPVMARCAGRLAGAEERLPVKSKAKPPRPEYRLVALVEGGGALGGRVLVRRRPDTGLLARMWELPHIPADAVPGEGAGLPDGPAMDRLAAALAAAGMPARPGEAWMNAEHTFSHIHWNLRVFRFAAEDAAGQAENDEAENDVAVTGGTDGMTGSAEAAYGQAPYAGASVAAPNSVPYAGNADSAAQHQAAAGSAGLFAAETAAAYEAEANQAGEASASTGWAEQEAASPAGDGVKQAGFDLAADSAEYRWITKEDMGSLAFPNVFLRILNRYFKQV
ncbi:MAG: A/G-specific adenine glycosylase [Paenibacillus macerans]|uniref:A/G-specific adenine glycosylase n=1 Tax=Paenibacillus macerans TaxID=44252 RepID=UPI00290E8463|nr:A/G-specific adenine glycosylase [Paenibacillus macerans]MDU7475188.1 A/G-specific adenine glycosylase [Paenibacillus macerans]